MQRLTVDFVGIHQGEVDLLHGSWFCESWSRGRTPYQRCSTEINFQYRRSHCVQTVIVKFMPVKYKEMCHSHQLNNLFIAANFLIWQDELTLHCFSVSFLLVSVIPPSAVRYRKVSHSLLQDCLSLHTTTWMIGMRQQARFSPLISVHFGLCFHRAYTEVSGAWTPFPYKI